MSAEQNRLERQKRNAFIAQKQRFDTNWALIMPIMRQPEVSEEDQVKIAEAGQKRIDLDDQEVKSGLLIGRTQNAAITAAERSELTDLVIATFDSMIQQFEKLNTSIEAILARYEKAV